jgi:hypothetical protein
MRQDGTMREGKLMREDLAEEIERSGRRLIVRRLLENGGYTYFAVYAKGQALTPTFVHTLRSNGTANTAENDQHDFICVGQIAMQELDEFCDHGWVWAVSSAAEMETTQDNVTTHCLSVRLHQELF